MSRRYHQRRFALPANATEIILIRHGATAPAVPGAPFDLVDGHGDPPLDPVGEGQAQAVADRLGDEPIERIFVSGLLRTVQTAAPLATRLGIEPGEVPALREIRLGDWEGGVLRIKSADGDPLAIRLFQEERWDVIPGAEPMEEFAARVRAGVDTIVAATTPGTSVAAVVHGGVIGELCHQATRSRPFAFVHAENGSFTRLVVFQDGRWMLRTFNDTSHLD